MAAPEQPRPLEYATEPRRAPGRLTRALPVILFGFSVVLFIAIGPLVYLLPNDGRRTIDIGLNVMSLIIAAAGLVFGIILFVRTRDAAALLGVGMNLVWLSVLIIAVADTWHLP